MYMFQRRLNYFILFLIGFISIVIFLSAPLAHAQQVSSTSLTTEFMKATVV